ncbi:MAG TPA: hypothetical protein VMY37_02495 [Thermoguttaceae bacterium]|nr:hypothetical protein [Thermoguttaceae bacterium]
MHCPDCGAEVGEGDLTCPDCYEKTYGMCIDINRWHRWKVRVALREYQFATEQPVLSIGAGLVITYQDRIEPPPALARAAEATEPARKPPRQSS